MHDLHRAILHILKLLYGAPEGLKVAEIAHSLGLPPHRVRKALAALEAEGFTAQDPLTRRHLLCYPHPFLELPRAPDDPLFYQDLAEAAFAQTGFRAYVLTLRPWGLHLEATGGNRGQRLWPSPKERKPPTPHAHASAGGRAILAHLREEPVRAHLHRFPPRPLTVHAPATVAQVEARLEEARRLGFAPAQGELIPDRCGLAVPLLTATGEAFGALGLSLPLGKTCVFPAPNDPRACRRCTALAPALKEVVRSLWPSSAA